MLRDNNIILVMHEDTYEIVNEMMVETADIQAYPIAFIKEFNSIEIVTDNEVPF